MKKLNIVFFIFFIIFCFSCSNNEKLNREKNNGSEGRVDDTSNERKLSSENIGNAKERVAVLSREIKMFSNIENAEFDLFNVNGFSNTSLFFPGASSWRYLFVIKVLPEDIEKWKTDLIAVEHINETPKWALDLIKIRNTEWNITSTPKFYTRNESGSVEIIIFEKEGIIFKRIIQD